MTDRNPAWAQVILIPGLPNLFKVSDTLYRGAEPQKWGYKNLPGLCVKTVISFEEWTDEADMVEAAGMAFYGIPQEPWHPEEEDVVAFLRIVMRPGVYFAHCVWGADRTGLACAVYRIFIQGWSKADAINELFNGGYGAHWEWKPFIESFIQNLNVQRIQAQL